MLALPRSAPSPPPLPASPRPPARPPARPPSQLAWFALRASLRVRTRPGMLQALVSGLVNGGPVAGGTMQQIEAQSTRRQPCVSFSFRRESVASVSDRVGARRRHRCDLALEQVVQGKFCAAAFLLGLLPRLAAARLMSRSVSHRLV